MSDKKSDNKRIANDAIISGGIMTGLGAIGRKAAKIAKNHNTVEKETAIKALKGSKAVMISGAAITAAGAGFKAYQHYKDKKAKAAEEKTKNFDVPEVINDVPPSVVPAQEQTQAMMIEQMKMQRAIMANQRQRQRLQAEEAQNRVKALQNAQKVAAQKDEAEQKNRIQAMTLESKENEAKNVGLYKTRSTIIPPVSMK